MAAYKGHPAWLGKAMQTGGGVSSQDRYGEGGLEQVIKDEPRGVGNPNALLGGAGLAALYKGVTAKNPIAKALGAVLGTAAAGIGGQGVAKDIGKMVKARDAKVELEKRDEADRQSGGYKRGGRAKRKS